MALKPDSDKPMLPLEKPPLPAGHVQCADDENCRKPGRLWFEGMEPQARVCVDHASDRYAKGQEDAIAPRRHVG